MYVNQAMGRQTRLQLAPAAPGPGPPFGPTRSEPGPTRPLPSSRAQPCWRRPTTAATAAGAATATALVSECLRCRCRGWRGNVDGVGMLTASPPPLRQWCWCSQAVSRQPRLRLAPAPPDPNLAPAQFEGRAEPPGPVGVDPLLPPPPPSPEPPEWRRRWHSCRNAAAAAAGAGAAAATELVTEC